MEKCRSRNGEIGMEKWGKEGEEKWRNGNWRNRHGEMGIGKWKSGRERNGNQCGGEMENGVKEKWKWSGKRNGAKEMGPKKWGKEMNGRNGK